MYADESNDTRMLLSNAVLMVPVVVNRTFAEEDIVACTVEFLNYGCQISENPGMAGI